MAVLPLFPLNAVLFPGMQLKLHIFEDRYKTMINHCIEADEPFGVVLIRHGDEGLGPGATPYTVGCAAGIDQVQKLPLGRMNIVTTGRRRFRIKAIDKSNSYLLGDVEYFIPADDRPKVVQVYGRALRPLLLRYVGMLASSTDSRIDLNQLPKQPRAVAQIASILLQTDNPHKQELLAIDSLSSLLMSLVDIYRLETILLKIRLSPPGDEFNIGCFSRN